MYLIEQKLKGLQLLCFNKIFTYDELLFEAQVSVETVHYLWQSFFSWGTGVPHPTFVS